MTRFAETALRQHLSRLNAQHVSDGAIVVLDNQSGDVLALVGSENYLRSGAGQVNGAWAPRSPGSTLKPFTYLLALEHGATPATIVADVPTEFATATGLFAPVNYNRHCYGPMRYRLALANSLNISAVKVLASHGGPAPLQQLLQQCGLSTLDRPAEHYGLGLTIGNAEARLLELANAYACLARLGEYKPYRGCWMQQASGDDLTSVPRPPTARAGGRPPPQPISSPTFLATTTRAHWPSASNPHSGSTSLSPARPAPARTSGTTGLSATPPSSRSASGWGTSTALRWNTCLVSPAPRRFCMICSSTCTSNYGTTWYATPTNIVECWVHPVTGKRLSQNSAFPSRDAIREKFLASNLPPLERPADYEAAGIHRQPAVRLGGEYRDWLASSDNWLGDGAVLAPTHSDLHILFPPPGTILYLDPDLPQRGGRIVLRNAGSENVQWQSDSLEVRREGPRQVALLAEGRHRLAVRDPLTGAQASTWVEVLAR